MSPSLASWATKAGPFFSSPGWKRVFSKRTMSPFFIAATACSTASPTQSSMNLTGRLMMCATSAATGLSEFFWSRPFGRPKCESKITLAPLSAISVMALAMRSMRVPSVTTPFSTGTLRSTRTSTRFPFTSTWSRVRNALMVRSAARGQISLPIATAVSAMRLEKPHSLSYHDITRTSVPSITLVWSMWKTEECGSWLKSIETLGAVV